MKKQVVLIHGGDVWESYEVYLEWLKNRQVDFQRHALSIPDFQMNLVADLGSDYEVIRPRMPNLRNAKYVEWKIWFEKFLPFLNDGVVLIGNSLGGTFLAKYLAENDFPKKIQALFLIAASFEDLTDEPLLSFALPAILDKITSQVGKITLYHSEDDSMVPLSHVYKFKESLPQATVRIFEDRGHFNQEHLPELVKDIKNL